MLSPTRELAQQIADSFRTYGAGSGVTVAVFVGGVKYGAQIKSVAGGVDVLVATPGRLIDHIQQGNVRLDETEIFVLDEADQMLDLGFLEPIRKLVRKLPRERQNLFFSATMPGAIATLAGEILRDPLEVRVAPQATTVERVVQRVIHVEADRKRDILVDLLAPRDVSRAIVFTRTKRGADRLAKFVDAAGVEVAAIHGDKSQGQRERALAAFKAGRVKALIATDIAARGIDVEAVSHVFNYELPNVPEAYVHRIGRTARAGGAGHRHQPLRRRRARHAARDREADAARHSRRGSALRRPHPARRVVRPAAVARRRQEAAPSPRPSHRTRVRRRIDCAGAHFRRPRPTGLASRSLAAPRAPRPLEGRGGRDAARSILRS